MLHKLQKVKKEKNCYIFCYFAAITQIHNLCTKNLGEFLCYQSLSYSGKILLLLCLRSLLIWLYYQDSGGQRELTPRTYLAQEWNLSNCSVTFKLPGPSCSNADPGWAARDAAFLTSSQAPPGPLVQGPLCAAGLRATQSATSVLFSMMERPKRWVGCI